jgi:hypothetical protein
MSFYREACVGTGARGEAKHAEGAAKAPYPLSPRASALVAQLADSIRLRALPTECPEVLDLLASRWNDERALAQTFDHLLYGTSREVPKLSMRALLEVTNVQCLAASRLPRRRHSVWDLAFEAG